MSKHVQIRDIPDELHRRLKARAAMEGQSMSAFVRKLIERAVTRPSQAEILDALAALPPVETGVSAAEFLREARRERTHGA